MYLDHANDRHPATKQIARYFDFDHLKTPLREVSRDCAELAGAMIDQLPDGSELTTGLRKLLEAKDCFVRAAADTAQCRPIKDNPQA